MLDVNKPILIINKNLCLNNIEKILEICIYNNIEFRPHFKTHQSLEVGSWFKKLGIKSITVSSVSMAEYFSDQWDDITIAFPFNILEIDIINDLSKYININLLIDYVPSDNNDIKYLEWYSSDFSNEYSLTPKFNVDYIKLETIDTTEYQFTIEGFSNVKEDYYFINDALDENWSTIFFLNFRMVITYLCITE